MCGCTQHLGWLILRFAFRRSKVDVYIIARCLSEAESKEKRPESDTDWRVWISDKAAYSKEIGDCHAITRGVVDVDMDA